jgi:hypothetical protein
MIFQSLQSFLKKNKEKPETLEADSWAQVNATPPMKDTETWDDFDWRDLAGSEISGGSVTTISLYSLSHVDGWA